MKDFQVEIGFFLLFRQGKSCRLSETIYQITLSFDNRGGHLINLFSDLTRQTLKQQLSFLCLFKLLYNFVQNHIPTFLVNIIVVNISW